MPTKGYHTYRGRSSGGKRAAVIVMIVVLILACAYLIFNEFTVFESDGSVRFHLPWSAPAAQSQDAGASGTGTSETDASGTHGGDVELVIDEPRDPLTEVRAAEIDAAALEDGFDALRTSWKENGYNAVGVRLKNSDGLVRYASSAAEAENISGAAVSPAALRQLTESDFYAIARISCFHDSAAAMGDMAGLGLCQNSGYIWYDNNNTHWLDPGKTAARSYVVSLCRELAGLGFDEILLDDMRYPTTGRLSKIRYTADRTESIDAFLTELQTALAGTDVRLGVVLDEAAVLSGGSDAEGISLPSVLAAADRVYVRTSDGAAVTAAIHALNRDTSVVIFGAAEGNRYSEQ